MLKNHNQYMRLRVLQGWYLTAALAIWGTFVHAAAVAESSREIPVAQEVDVVIVGGSCGAIAAAEAAAAAGAKVFLVAPRPYLGDDLAGALRLWLEPGENPESPLAKSLFLLNEISLPFAYTTDVPSGGKHPDKDAMLCDGQTDDVQTQTVEYAKDVTILADLQVRTTVEFIELIAFRSKGDYDVESVHISLSEDGKTWSPAIPLNPKESGYGPASISFAAQLQRPISRIKIVVKKPANAKRILISEIRVCPAGLGTEIVVPTPLRVKQVLDKTLLDAGVAFLTSSYVTDVLRDAQGMPSGIVIANRSGRQVIKAKVIVDATERAFVARLAGARFQQYPQGAQTFERIVIAGEKPAAPGMIVKELPGDFTVPLPKTGNLNAASFPKEIIGRAYLCTLTINMPDSSFRSFAEAEQIARDHTFVKTLLDASDSLFQLPPDAILDTLPRLHVLGGCAGVSRTAAAKYLRPLALMDAGARVGALAAKEAAGLPPPLPVDRLCAIKGDILAKGEVQELLGGLRPFQKCEHVQVTGRWLAGTGRV